MPFHNNIHLKNYTIVTNQAVSNFKKNIEFAYNILTFVSLEVISFGAINFQSQYKVPR